MVGRLIVLLIIVNLVAVALESVPELETRYAAPFLVIELVSLFVFTCEYGLRMWVAVEPCRRISIPLYEPQPDATSLTRLAERTSPEMLASVVMDRDVA